MKTSEIRELFLQYFHSKAHKELPSSSLIPANDPSLLFTTAGMVQFKPFFTGIQKSEYSRVTTVQKCLRTTDLENVGRTERHCTFFEMLGNFSFGDYFKEGAISFAWEFSTKYLKFPEEKIWISVFETDDEAIEIWKKIGVPEERIVRLGKEDNFWGPAGETGACGPCSELYLDRGIEKAGDNCKKSGCKPGCDCDRYLEFWNLVFIQYNQDLQKKFHDLEQKGIDTGSGLERVAVLKQNVDSVYDTDELQMIIRYIESLVHVKYENQLKIPFRVISDHARAIVFAICDGIMPDKTGRGYVVRRLIRRALLFSRKLGWKKPILHKTVIQIIEIYSKYYPSLLKEQKNIENILEAEEELFLHTLENGMMILEEMIQICMKDNSKEFSGEDGFKLYGTYGFPPEMTEEILLEHGIRFNKEEFNQCLERDKEESRETWKGKKIQVLASLDKPPQESEFSGYTGLAKESVLLEIILDSKSVEELNQGMKGILVFKETPFYGESGGQTGDRGKITGNNVEFTVIDTQKENGVILHIGEVTLGKIQKKKKYKLEVDSKRRLGLASAHSGTHLLNGALRKLLGNHIAQKASLVEDNFLRFDFSHPKALTSEEIQKVESLVNEAIMSRQNVDTQVLKLEEAKKTGAVAVFDEKYGEQIRVVGMGEFSKEFCGGTHVDNTEKIVSFVIVKESSPGAGNRRLEAYVGSKVAEYFYEEFNALNEQIRDLHQKSGELSEELIQDSNLDPMEITKQLKRNTTKAILDYKLKLKKKQDELEKIRTDLIKLEKQKNKEKVQTRGTLQSIFQNSIQLNFSTIYYSVLPGFSPSQLREVADKCKEQDKNAVVFLVGENQGQLQILIMAQGKVLEAGFHSGDLMKELNQQFGTRGGGKSDMAQGGGAVDSSEKILAFALEKIKFKLGG